MIAVVRGPQPMVLARHARQWAAALAAATTAEQRRAALERYRHQDIRARLVKRFHGKCAYCESKIMHVDFGAIEHHRPKAAFPALAFAWDNLLLACNRCNAAKGDRFPEAAEGGPIVDPCADNPAEHLHFRISPKRQLTTVAARTTRGRKTVELLRLNRRDLQRHRSGLVRKLKTLRILAVDHPEAAALLAEAIAAGGEYAAFARAALA